jgi:hypothetical protein
LYFCKSSGMGQYDAMREGYRYTHGNDESRNSSRIRGSRDSRECNQAHNDIHCEERWQCMDAVFPCRL